MRVMSSSALLPFSHLCLHSDLPSCSKTTLLGIQDHFIADGDRWVLAGEEFADAMQKAGHEEIEKSLRNMALKASSEISAGAAVQYGKMSIVARRENHG